MGIDVGGTAPRRPAPRPSPLSPGGVASTGSAAGAMPAAALGMTLADEDRSNQLLDVETQVAWLREIGFAQVDCFWKWRELALFGGVRP